MAKTGRPLSTKALAMRTLRDSTAGSATKYAALIAAKPHLSFEEYGLLLRQLAAVARSKVLRLCLLALADHETQERVRAAAGKVAANERAEIDQILCECEAELAAEKAGTEGPKQIPESVVTESAEPPPAAPSVPRDGPSSEREPTPAVHAETEQPRREILERLLTRGRALAGRILAQLERLTIAPFNQQEGSRMDALHRDWRTFEKEAAVAGLDIEKEFGDKLKLIRPSPVRIDLAQRRRTALAVEQLVMEMLTPAPRQSREADYHADSGFWGGIPSGV